jgi:Cd2+/Zn2+-exporting ATPase
MVEEAQAAKSPAQAFTEKIETWYVPFVLAMTAALIVAPPLLLPRFAPAAAAGWATWFYRSMAFLTGASPCALAIGTPAAVLSGIARAARYGVLVKGGIHLEGLAQVTAIALDKTGTLTRGQPSVTKIVAIPPSDEAEVLALAAAVERGSSHPLAQAIAAEAMARSLAEWPATELAQVAAQGVTATVNGRRVAVGRHSMIPAGATGHDALIQEIERLSTAGMTAVAVGALADASGNGDPSHHCALGAIGLADRPRGNAAAAISALKSLGIQKTVMLTGDHAGVAAAVAAETGVDEFRASLMPGDKVEVVRQLQSQGFRVAMIGDGVNDAPALAAADVGIAMGAGGTDVALETADVALMGDDLAKLPGAIQIARFSRRVIRQNVAIALGVIALLAPMAAIGVAPLGLAVLFHEGSTVVVVLNALRLLRYRPRAG